MSLESYKKRRNFSKTPEPKPVPAKKVKKIYVIQKHYATRVHYDLRLAVGKVLKSWALPKEPSLNEKRLAIQTEDHPVAYAKFRGTIPKGNYGAGKVERWDSGYFTPVGSKTVEQQFRRDKIEFNLHGRKLKGTFVILKFRDKNWLFFKEKHDKK